MSIKTILNLKIINVFKFDMWNIERVSFAVSFLKWDDSIRDILLPQDACSK